MSRMVNNPSSPPDSPASVPAIVPVNRKEIQVTFGPGLFGFVLGVSTSREYTTCLEKFVSLPNGKPSAAQAYNASVNKETRCVCSNSPFRIPFTPL